MIRNKYPLFMLIYLLCVWCRTTHQQPVGEQRIASASAEAAEPVIPAIYNRPPAQVQPVKILREPSPITEKESMKAGDDLQQSESYTYSYYRPLYYPGVYYSYYPTYRWYNPYYYYNWWYY